MCVGLREPMLRAVLGAVPGCRVLDCEVADEELLRLCRGPGFTIVLVDEQCLDRHGAKAIRPLAALGSVQVVVIASKECLEVQHAAFAAGCAGVLPVHAPGEVYARALEAVRAGELWFSRAVLSRLARESVIAERKQRLTARELEILELVGADKKNQAIADMLYISRETVRWHLRTMYSKLGVSDRTAAREYARGMQMLSPGETSPGA